MPILISDRAATARIKPERSGAAGRQGKATWWGEGQSIHTHTTPPSKKHTHLQILIICLWCRPTNGGFANITTVRNTHKWNRVRQRGQSAVIATLCCTLSFFSIYHSEAVTFYTTALFRSFKQENKEEIKTKWMGNENNSQIAAFREWEHRSEANSV